MNANRIKTLKNPHGLAHRSTLQRSLRMQALEPRCVLNGFGVPWPEPRSLSISFPSDTAEIGHYPNEIRSLLDNVTDRREWQAATLRAFQTWAVQANINVGLVPDRGDDFGAIGLTSNDPRFGELRIGAFPQGGVLASAAPFQPIAGTWSGDVLLNTQTNYFLGDWNSGAAIEVPSGSDQGPAIELFSVLLHEAGNALGIPDNAIPGAVMNGVYQGPNGRLKTSDIQAIRNLYGARQDIFESTRNDSRSTATRIVNPTGYRGREPLSVNGSLNRMNDVDFYRITPLANQEKVNIRLWAAGISLLKAKLEVFDRYGNKIGDVKADDIFNNNLELEIGSLEDPKHRVLFVRVARNADDVFAIGDYRLEIDYRPYDQQPSIIPPSHDADENDDDSELPWFAPLDEIFHQAGLVDSEAGANDTLSQSSSLQSPPGFLANTRFEVTSAISSASDRDLWRFRSPAHDSPLLSLSISPLGYDAMELEVVLLNATGDRVASDIVRKPDGTISLTTYNPIPDSDYLLFVRATNGSPSQSGNYFVTVDFATNQSDTSLVALYGVVTSDSEQFSQLNVRRTQLFRIDLQALAGSVDAAAQVSVYDQRSGELIKTIAANAGTVESEFVWLSGGNYIVQVSGFSRIPGLDMATEYRVWINGLSDDQGPNPLRPDEPYIPPLGPDYELLPLTPETIPPVINYYLPPFEDPWTTKSTDEFFAEYYRIFLA